MSATMKIAVAGATGRVGRPLVDTLRARGCEVVAIARSTGVDVITGDGLAEALDGVDVIVDAATSPSPDQVEATSFFTTAARNLHEAGRRAGVRRMVVVSIIGVDHFTAGYNAAKLAHEQAALAGPVPVRILRSAQFHELVPLLDRVGTAGRRQLRAGDADPARGGQRGRRGAGRPGHGRRCALVGAVHRGTDPGGRRAAGGEHGRHACDGNGLQGERDHSFLRHCSSQGAKAVALPSDITR